MEAHQKHDFIKAIISILCLGFAILWWIRPITNKHVSTKATINTCDNPSCLRCHSTSQQHRQSFQRNVMMLRRLVQHEPDLFLGMRNEIWEEVAMLEQRFERSDHYNNGALLQKILELLKRIRHTFMKPKSSNDTATCKQEVIPLSPQPGQNPTVFFLQRLEAIPLHNLETCTKRHCPCIRLWKEVPRIPNSPPVKLTGDLDALKTYFSVIRKELLDVIQTNTTTLFLPFDSAVYKLANDNLDDRQQLQQQLQQAEWSSIYLYRQGIKQVETCKKYFPISTNIIETMCPHRMSGCGLGSVYFSKLKQNTKIVEHCGPSNVRLRCHLPLFVPSKTSVGSYLRVAERCICWEEGEPILFDDSFLHSAVYVGSGDTSASSTGDRIVLIADLWHPSLAVSDRTALAVLYPPGS